jgi:hypothetical protein
VAAVTGERTVGVAFLELPNCCVPNVPIGASLVNEGAERWVDDRFITGTLKHSEPGAARGSSVSKNDER